MAEECRRRLGVEDDGARAGRGPARPEAAERPACRLLSDGGGRIEPRELPVRGVPVIALHEAVARRDGSDREARVGPGVRAREAEARGVGDLPGVGAELRALGVRDLGRGAACSGPSCSMAGSCRSRSGGSVQSSAGSGSPAWRSGAVARARPTASRARSAMLSAEKSAVETIAVASLTNTRSPARRCRARWSFSTSSRRTPTASPSDSATTASAACAPAASARRTRSCARSARPPLTPACRRR